MTKTQVVALLAQLTKDQITVDAHTTLFHLAQFGVSDVQLHRGLRSAVLFDGGGLPNSCIVEFEHDERPMLCRFEITANGLRVVGLGWR